MKMSMKLLDEFKRVKALSLDYLTSLAFSESGYPLLLIAPSGAGKTQVVKATQQFLDKQGYPTRYIDKMNLTSLKVLEKWLNDNTSCVLINDDFSSIGTSEYNTEKTATLIGRLTLDKRFSDDGMHIKIDYINKLGFLSGVQPEWLSDIVLSKTWRTFWCQRFIRYYMLPCSKIEVQLEPDEVIKELVDNTICEIDKKVDNEELKDALILQLGQGRGITAYKRVRQSLYKYFGKNYEFLCHQLALRLNFEQKVLRRDYDLLTRRFIVQVNDIEFTILNIALRYNPLSYKDLSRELNLIVDKEGYNRTLSMLLERTEMLNWVTRLRTVEGNSIVVNPEFRKEVSI